MKKIIDSWIFDVPISHRGLFDNIFKENTEPAFLNSIAHNYAIETDVQLTLDGVLVCYHDDNLKRGFNIDKDIRDVNYSEIKNLKAFGGDYPIMTFSDFLKLVDGQVPILIEVKTQKQKGIEQKIIEELENYKGKFAIQSFNPKIIKNFSKLKPNYTLGILTTREISPTVPKLIRFMMLHFWFKYYVKTDFLSVRVEDLIVNYKYYKNSKIITWTVKNNLDLELASKYALNIIFESTLENLGKFDK